MRVMTLTKAGMMIMTERRITTVIFTMIDFIPDSLSRFSLSFTPCFILEFGFGLSTCEDSDFNTYRVDVAIMLWKKKREKYQIMQRLVSR